MTCRDCIYFVSCADSSRIEDPCLNFKNKADFVEVAEITEKIEFAIKATNMNSDYDMGLRNGLRLAQSFIDGKQPQYERSDM